MNGAENEVHLQDLIDDLTKNEEGMVLSHKEFS